MRRLLLLLCGALVSCAVDGRFQPLPVQFVGVPAAWLENFGEPSWRTVYIYRDGMTRVEESDPGEVLMLELDRHASVPVLAWPYWPRRGIAAGLAQPCGALYPFGMRGASLLVSPEGGVLAWFYRALESVAGPEERAAERFDWTRFRSLLEATREETGLDPWSVDWALVALKTRASGFDSRRLAAAPCLDLVVPAPADGPWMPGSPFAAPVEAVRGEPLRLASGATLRTLLGASGCVRYQDDVWLWRTWEAPLLR